MKKLMYALLLLVGCLRDLDQDYTLRIACLGDSNTAAADNWCVKAAASFTHGFVHTGTGVQDVPFVWMTYAQIAATSCPVAYWYYSGSEMGEALTDNADVVIAAFVTNDWYWGIDPPADTVACLHALEGQGPVVFVALGPPSFTNDPLRNPGVEAVNAAIVAGFPANRVIDFASGFTSADFHADGVHANDAGQIKRAARVISALALFE